MSDWRRENKYFDKHDALSQQGGYCVSTSARWVTVEGKGQENCVNKRCINAISPHAAPRAAD